MCFFKNTLKILVACIFMGSCGPIYDVPLPEAIRTSKNPDGGTTKDPHDSGGQATNANKQGACDAEDELIFSNNADFTALLRSCGKSQYGLLTSHSEHSRLTANCIRNTHKNLTIVCGACFGDFASCGAANCKSKCWTDATSSGCKACGRAHCGEAWERCSGSSLKVLAD